MTLRMPSTENLNIMKKKRFGSCQGSHNAILSQYAINCANDPVWQDSNLTLVTKKLCYFHLEDVFIQSNLQYVYYSNNPLGATGVKCFTQRHNGDTLWLLSSRAHTSNLLAFSHHEIIYNERNTFKIGI